MTAQPSDLDDVDLCLLGQIRLPQGTVHTPLRDTVGSPAAPTASPRAPSRAPRGCGHTIGLDCTPPDTGQLADSSEAGNCMICSECTQGEGIEWPGCGHQACRGCLAQYFRSRCVGPLSSAESIMRCPCPYVGAVHVADAVHGGAIEACRQLWRAGGPSAYELALDMLRSSADGSSSPGPRPMIVDSGTCGNASDAFLPQPPDIVAWCCRHEETRFRRIEPRGFFERHPREMEWRTTPPFSAMRLGIRGSIADACPCVPLQRTTGVA